MDANAWAALGLLEGYRVVPVESHRRAALQILRFAVAQLFDAQRGAFGDAKSLPLALDANGVMAEALLLAQQAGGPAKYADLTRRGLTTFGGSTRALLAESDDAAARAPDAVYYLRADAQVVARHPAGEQRR